MRYNAINQQYWLQYHGIEDTQIPTSSSETHLIQPSNTSATYAACHHLVLLLLRQHQNHWWLLSRNFYWFIFFHQEPAVHPICSEVVHFFSK